MYVDGVLVFQVIFGLIIYWFTKPEALDSSLAFDSSLPLLLLFLYCGSNCMCRPVTIRPPHDLPATNACGSGYLPVQKMNLYEIATGHGFLFGQPHLGQKRSKVGFCCLSTEIFQLFGDSLSVSHGQFHLWSAGLGFETFFWWQTIIVFMCLPNSEGEMRQFVLPLVAVGLI